ncbi:hypothetical protein CDL15_Pgr005423 [Punica granatum]|uniref:Uncharacterized protein n=1 Tax=Punica granatum TaxID=22663 RepID=A0A218Y3S9_PUNGR|nr:hypothetical protein CDL15_Pgr005423 [Punica granatum]
MGCRKVSSHGLADPARLQEARERWLGELAMQESNLARVSRPDKVSRGKRDVGGGSASLRCKKVNSHGLADPARLQEARARWLGELAVQENPVMLQEARALWHGELKVQESKLAQVSIPGKADRGTSKTGQGCKRDEGGGSENLRCMKLNSHGLADAAILQEARARWLGELAVEEIKLARVSKPSKVESGQSEVASKLSVSKSSLKRHARACHRAPQRPSSTLPCPSPSTRVPVIEHPNVRHRARPCPSSTTLVPVTEHPSVHHQHARARQLAHPRPSPAPPAPVIQRARARHPARPCPSPVPVTERHQRPSSSTPVPVTECHQHPSSSAPVPVIQHARARRPCQSPSATSARPLARPCQSPSATCARHPARSCLSPHPPAPIVVPSARHRA